MERIPGFLASAYNKAAVMVTGSYYSQVADEIVSELESGTFLDLGTGPGYLPIEIVKRAPAIKVDGIDLTPEFIRIGRENSIRAGLTDKLHFEVMDAAKLQAEDNFYDMVFSSGMLHALSRPRVAKVLKECYRVLKPGGKLWIFDPAKVCSGIDRKVWWSSLTFREKFLCRLFIFYESLTPPHYYSKEEITRIVADTDFDSDWVEEKDEELKVKLRKPQ
jgi:ubiquinone/menaquinone biosynthesis C-methylase UbiE